MIRCVIISIAAFALTPLVSFGQNATLEMTTAASLGPNGSIFPSSLSIELESLSPSVTTYTQLPDVLYSIVNGNNVATGLIDLDFTLIIGSETITKTATHRYDIFSEISGPGAHGGTASLDIAPAPIVFDTDLGRFTVNYSSANANHLGRPQGWNGTVPLTVGLLFARVPEPSSCALGFSSLAILLCHRRRVTVPQQ